MSVAADVLAAVAVVVVDVEVATLVVESTFSLFWKWASRRLARTCLKG